MDQPWRSLQAELIDADGLDLDLLVRSDSARLGLCLGSSVYQSKSIRWLD